MRPNEPSTPPPVYSNIAPPSLYGERMEHTEKKELRMAANLVRQQYPGPAGELLYKELMVWEEFGYRLDNSGLIMRLIREVLGAAKPKTP